MGTIIGFTLPLIGEVEGIDSWEKWSLYFKNCNNDEKYTDRELCIL